MRHLLVTNDFPPKLGGIQSYLWELWRRLPTDAVTVLTTAYPGSTEWDAEQDFRVLRTPARYLVPTAELARRIDDLAADVDAKLVVLDPALPVGLVGPRLTRPYGVVLHGAEVTVPGRLPVSKQLLRRVLCGARLVIGAGGYPISEGERAATRHLPTVVVPPGIDVERFRPLSPDERDAARVELGLPVAGRVVLGLSRLVPRKGFDVLIRAVARLIPSRPDLLVVIGGAGRDQARLGRLAKRVGAPVRFVGRVPDEQLPRLYGAADVFAMLCRGNRWFGLEQEGFGIVFLEAAACGVPQVAGDSGGSAEAVLDGSTGYVVEPTDVEAVATALARLLDDAPQRAAMGEAARRRAVEDFDHDMLATRLADALREHA